MGPLPGDLPLREWGPHASDIDVQTVRNAGFERAANGGANDETRTQLRTGGALQDISPTILAYLGERQPKEMSGRDLRI